MDGNAISGKFDNLSQRVAFTYLRMLAPFIPTLPDGLAPEQQAEMAESQAELHAFFHALYEAVYDSPGQFGLPVTEDVFYLVDHSKEGPNKTEIKRILDKPRKMVAEGLDFLRAVGKAGRLEGGRLAIGSEDPVLGFIKKKPGRAWLHGMADTGLVFAEASDTVTASNERYPKMMLALKALAEATLGCKNEVLGHVFFARCDFRALNQDFSIVAPELFRIFKPEDAAHADELHSYFTGRNYQPVVEMNHLHQWVVKYQGKKSIKSTPLFQVEYDERYIRQIKAGIKCVSSSRVVPLLPAQSQELQEDFARRSIRCGNCHWCDNQKTLGPVEYVYQGETRKICWYVNSDIEEITDQMISLVKEYTVMHEAMK